MKAKAIIGGLTTLSVLGGLVGQYASNRYRKETDTPYRDYELQNDRYLGFALSGDYDSTTGGKVEQAVTRAGTDEIIGYVYTDLLIVRKNHSDVFTDAILIRSTLEAVDPDKDIFMKSYNIELGTSDTDNIQMIQYAPENEGDSIDFNIGFEVSTDGLGFSAGEEFSTDSVDMEQSSERFRNQYHTSYTFNPSLREKGKDWFGDSKSEKVNNHCRNAVFYGACVFDSKLESYDLQLHCDWSFVERIGSANNLMAMKLKPAVYFRNINLNASSFNEWVHVGRTANIITPVNFVDGIVPEETGGNEADTPVTPDAQQSVTPDAQQPVTPDAQQPDAQQALEDAGISIITPQTEPRQEQETPQQQTQPQQTQPQQIQPQQPETPQGAVGEIVGGAADAASGAIPDTESVAGQAAQQAADIASDAFRKAIDAVSGAGFETGKDYYIVPRSNSNLAVTAGGSSNESAITVEKLGAARQKWHFECVGTDRYYIVNSDSGLVLDIRVYHAKDIVNKTTVQLYSPQDGVPETQMFRIEKVNGAFAFRPANNTAYQLDVYGDVTKAGAKCQMYKTNNNDTQLFTLIEA